MVTRDSWNLSQNALMYGELALKTKPRNPKYRMCGCQAGGSGKPS